MSLNSERPATLLSTLRIAEVRELALPQHLMKNKCSQIIHPLNKDCQALILAIRLLGTVRQIMKSGNEGWAGDITAPHKAKTHYYKDGVSLCGKAQVKKHMKQFDKERTGSKWFGDCNICVKKEHEMLHEDPLCYKKSY